VKTDDFDYHLSESCIAQAPVEPRDSARLLVLHRSTRQVDHRVFREIGDYLEPGDLLILNRTRVIPARLYARKPTSGRVELLLLRRLDAWTWECLVGGQRVRPGLRLAVEGGPSAEVLADANGAERLVRFAEPIEPFLHRAGHVPLPPYIHRLLDDPERYQTVYATAPGSAAAPTAGLHFTTQLLSDLRARGIGQEYVTLHVGLDTFAPVSEDDPLSHPIHREWCEIPLATASAINSAHSLGKRVVAVGTTSVRALETAARSGGRRQGRSADSTAAQSVQSFLGDTSLFILPGYEFKCVDALITNFHLPRSTLLMLVSAFTGRELILDTYAAAQREGYRFYSFGDAMLIL